MLLSNGGTLNNGYVPAITVSNNVTNFIYSNNFQASLTNPITVKLASPWNKIPATAGIEFQIIVSSNNNIPRTISFNSTDNLAKSFGGLPDNYLLISPTTFNITLLESGSQSISVTDNTNDVAVIAVYVNSNNFGLYTPSNAVAAGIKFNIIVLTLSTFRGIVSFSTSDTSENVVLPSNYTFTASDNGTHVFSFVLATAGTQTVTVTSGTISETIGLTVSAYVAFQFSFETPIFSVTNTPFVFTLSALDENSNVTPSYRGTVSFSSSDTANGVVLPNNYTFTANDAGEHSFIATLVTIGEQTITAKDSANNITKVCDIVNTAYSHFPRKRPSRKPMIPYWRGV